MDDTDVRLNADKVKHWIDTNKQFPYISNFSNRIPIERKIIDYGKIKR